MVLNIISAELTDTDEVVLFRKKAQQIIDKIYERNFPDSREDVSDISYRVETLDIISLFTEALNDLEKKEYDQVLKTLENIQKKIGELSGTQSIRVLSKRIEYLPENRIAVHVRLVNESDRLIRDPAFTGVLIDDEGNELIRKEFFLLHDFISPGEKADHTCYFFNLADNRAAEDMVIEF
ncbi:MAG: hypothetical protein ACOCWO_05745 [Candidatus Muiribacteriaceae bacterium]